MGGQHRGRKIPIADLDGLRPTSDRTRETLFNWLQFELPGMAVLDLFAGTGALGLEALSRDAERAVFVEPQPLAHQNIKQSLDLLDLNGEVISAMANHYISICHESFDLIFVDPPFSADLWNSTLASIVSADLLKPAGYVYLECPRGETVSIPETLKTIKDKTAGKVHFRLLQKV